MIETPMIERDFRARTGVTLLALARPERGDCYRFDRLVTLVDTIIEAIEDAEGLRLWHRSIAVSRRPNGLAVVTMGIPRGELWRATWPIAAPVTTWRRLIAQTISTLRSVLKQADERLDMFAAEHDD